MASIMRLRYVTVSLSIAVHHLNNYKQNLSHICRVIDIYYIRALLRFEPFQNRTSPTALLCTFIAWNYPEEKKKQWWFVSPHSCLCNSDTRAAGQLSTIAL